MKYAWASALDEQEARHLYDTFHVPASGLAHAQMANATLNPWTESNVDTKNPERGPPLIIDGANDHTVPWAVANAAFKRQRRNPGVTEIREDPEPRSLAHDRPRVGGGRSDGARLREEIHLADGAIHRM